MRCVMRSAMLAAVLGIVGCAERSEFYGATRPRHGPDEIWTNLGTEPEYIDPGKVSDSAGGEVIVNLFDGLVERHPQTLAPMPAMAARWEMDADGRRYLFHLRQSVWSDGTPLTAHDFEYSWKRLLDPKTASKYGTFLHPLELGEAFNTGAVLVSGLGADVSEDDLRRLLGAEASRVTRVQLVPRLSVAVMFVDSERNDADVARKALIDRLEGAAHKGTVLHARVTDGSVVGVRALNDATLEVRIENPLPYFIDLLGYHVTAPVPRHVIDRLTRQGKNPDLWTRPEYLVCNGAYVIKEWKFRQYILFERNPRYWDVANVKTKRVRFAMVESYNTTLNLYKAGELDYIGANLVLPQEFTDHLAKYRDFHSDPYLSTYLFWVNTKRKPLDDVRVRRALSLAIDRAALVKYVTRGGQIPSADVVPDGLRGYRGPRSPIFDPEAARRLLREAGYRSGDAVPTVTLTYNTSEGHKQIAEAVQQMWKEHLGITVTLENQEWKVYLKSLAQMDFQVARLGWVGDYADPYTFLELLKSTNGNNHSLWSNARYDSLLHEANRTVDAERRLSLLREAEVLAMAEAPMIPLYVYTRSEMWKPYLMGHWPNYSNHHPAKYLWIDRRWYDAVPTSPLRNEPPPMQERAP